MREQIVDKINQKMYDLINTNEAASGDAVLRGMLLYALGMNEDGSVLNGGKRLRPLFCCLSCGALGVDYQSAIGYAAGLEMLHNFTLVHDDIEDRDDSRHNQPTLWRRNGLALALNAGDLLYEIALQTISETDETNGSHDGLIMSMRVSSQLFLGQHRDISFEACEHISQEDYFSMISGKTGALLGASFAMGALAAGVDKNCVDAFEAAGRLHGLAFQLRDDYLGTWGNRELTGKSGLGDIINKKNTLAVIFSADKNPEFRKRWAAYDGNKAESEWFADAMREAGAAEYLQSKCIEYSEQAANILKPYHKDNAYQAELDGLIASLLERNK